MPEKTDRTDILAFFNLEDENIDHISVTNHDDQTVVDVLLRPEYPPCPDCGSHRTVIKGYQLKVIKHGILTDRRCLIHYHARRYKCPLCGRTWYEHNPFTFSSMKISALTVHNVLRDLKEQQETFASVARRYHISPTSAASIFDRHVRMPRLPLPEYQCWDEAYAFHHQGENSKYVFTILDFRSQAPADILPSRKKEYLVSYFMKIPAEERKKVKMISTDMYKEYRSVIHDVFGSSVIHCCDHYHVSQELGRKVDRVRIRVMKSVPKYKKGTKAETDEYYLLKKFNWMIFKRDDARAKDKELLFDPGREKLMNRKLGRMLNFYDIRILIEDIHPDLKAAWRLKDSLTDFYDTCTYETAPEALGILIQKFYSSGIPEMQEFSKTLRNWKQEIINSFIIVKHDYKIDRDTGQVVVSAKKLNNGLMENRNSLLKTIKKNSNGYSNWDRFRNRCLYVLRADALPSLNPLEDEGGKAEK